MLHSCRYFRSRGSANWSRIGTLTPWARLTNPLVTYVGVAPNAQSACDFVNFVRLTAKNYQAIVLSMCWPTVWLLFSKRGQHGANSGFILASAFKGLRQVERPETKNFVCLSAESHFTNPVLPNRISPIPSSAKQHQDVRRNGIRRVGIPDILKGISAYTSQSQVH